MRRGKISTVSLLCVLAACSRIGIARPTTPSLPTVPSVPTTVAEATGEREVGSTPIRGAVVRSQLLALIGKTPDDAKALLLSYGHDGGVKVAPGPHHYDDCKMERVCSFDVPESGMGVHDPITLYVNPALKIAPPPS